jgi:hypothetical protein
MPGRVVRHGIEQRRAGQIAGDEAPERGVEPVRRRNLGAGRAVEPVGQPRGDGHQVLAARRLRGRGQFLGAAPGQPFLRRPGQGRCRGNGLAAWRHPTSVSVII